MAQFLRPTVDGAIARAVYPRHRPRRQGAFDAFQLTNSQAHSDQQKPADGSDRPGRDRLDVECSAVESQT